MTDFTAFDRAALNTEGPSAGTREARGSLALKVLAALNAAGVVLAIFPPLVPVAILLVVLFNLGAALLAIVYVAVAVGLDRNRPWAIAALRPLLILIAIGGVYGLISGIAVGKFRIPFDLFLAVWALLAPAERRTLAKVTRRSVGVVGAVVPMLVLMLFAQPLGAWGGTLDVHEPDLAAALTVDCPAAGAGLPAEIHVHYDWSWSSSGLLPSGTDIVVIGWSGTDSNGRTLYTYSSAPDGIGIYGGQAGYPSTDMANVVAHESAASFRWAIMVDEQRLQPAGIVLTLARARDSPPSPSPLVITATYVHAGLWRHDAPKVTCSW